MRRGMGLGLGEGHRGMVEDGSGVDERMPLVVRSIRRGDVPSIVAMLADDPLVATRERLADPIPDCYWRAFEAVEHNPSVDILVAELDRAVVGCLQLAMTPGLARQGMTRAQIEAVRVAGTQRGRRIGEAMVEEAIRRAKAAGCGLVELTTDKRRPDAHRFYERLGFAATHEGMKLMF
jgi:GNAT superfamily N-acetyltransferase